MTKGAQSVFIPEQNMAVDAALSGNPTPMISSGHDSKPDLTGPPPYPYKPVTHVLFDVDGLILDTGSLLTKAINEILSEFGKELAMEQRVELMGKRREDMIEDMIKILDLPLTPEELNKKYSNIVEPLYSQAKLLEGAGRLIRHFHALNIPIAVATSSSTSTLAEKTKNHRELFDLFHHVVTGSHPDLKNGKPAPDIFLLCASMFDPAPDPAQCLVFEDAPNGIQAACDSGMQSVMVPHQGLGSQYTLRATQVIHSLIDFKPSDFGLPAFR